VCCGCPSLVSGGVPQQLGVEQCAMFAAVGATNAVALDDLCGRLAAVYVKLTCARQSALHLQSLALATSNIHNAAPSIAAAGDR
jgi:hypothetical protein